MTPQSVFYEKYGNPLKDQKTFEAKFMKLFDYPSDITQNIPSIGKSIYCNKDFIGVYTSFLRLLIERKLHKEIRENDQCFCVRSIRGIPDFLSIHSWGMAVDLNPHDNPLGVDRNRALAMGLSPFTNEFIQSAIDSGLVAGYNFSRCDGMHFENTKGLYISEKNKL